MIAMPREGAASATLTAQMSRIFVGILLVITAGCGSDKAQPTTSGSGGGSDLAGSAAIAAPVTPALVDARPAPVLPDGGALTAQQTFEAQPRDPEWAAETERELARRWKQVRGAAIQGAECRQDQCRVVVAGSEGDVGQTIADLDSPRGLQSISKSVLLSAPSKRSDGKVELALYVMFER